MIRSLQSQGILKTPIVKNALQEINREDFLWPGDPKALAYIDEPLPLGDTDQTISAPHMIVMMLEALELSSGMKILEVGTGSGYNAALIAHIVSQGSGEPREPQVVTIERDIRLVEFATRNLAHAGLARVVKVVRGDGSLGYPERSQVPLYDRIVITAAAPSMPPLLLKQLRNDGIILAPVGGLRYQTLIRMRGMMKEEEQEKENFEREELIECMFVPLIGEQAFRV